MIERTLQYLREYGKVPNYYILKVRFHDCTRVGLPLALVPLVVIDKPMHLAITIFVGLLQEHQAWM